LTRFTAGAGHGRVWASGRREVRPPAPAMMTSRRRKAAVSEGRCGERRLSRHSRHEGQRLIGSPKPKLSCV